MGAFRFCLVLVAITGWALPAAAAEPFPPPGARAVTIGDRVTGSVDANALPYQWYRLHEEGVGELTVTLAGPGGDLDLELYGEDGVRLAFSNQSGSREEVTVETTRFSDFYAKVIAYGQTGKSPFTLSSSFTDGFPVVEPGQAVTAGLTAARPTRLYKVQVAGYGDLVVSLDGDDLTTDLDLEVLAEPEWQRLGSSTTAGNEEQVTVNCRKFDWYYLKVWGVNGAGSPFTLTTEYRDAVEPLGTDAVVNRAVAANRREYVFAIARPDKGFILFDLEGPQASDLDLEVYGTDRSAFTGNSRTSNEKLLVRSTPAVDQHVVVSLYQGEGGNFTLNTDHVAQAAPLGVDAAVTDEVKFTTNRIDLYQLAPARDGVVALTLTGAEAGEDVDLYVYNGDGTLAAASRLVDTSEENLLLPVAAGQPYYVAVVAFKTDDDNRYTLTAAADGRIAATAAAAGQTRADLVPRGNASRLYRFQMPAAGVFSLSAEAFNPQNDLDLEICVPGGLRKRSDAIGGREQVVLNVAAGEVVYARVWGYQTREDAWYLLTPELIVPGDLARGAAAPGTQYWGVFAGVQDYQTINDLSFTTADAVNLYDQFRAAGALPADHAALLVDEQATYANLKRAIVAAATRADTDDVLVIFFSGHGGAGAPDQAESPDESDGADEYLCAWDSNSENYAGDVLDDELKAWLAGTRAGLVLVMLDSCYSGGFESDLVNRPGVVGIFSSQEDKTSAEAATFRAGVLAYTLEQALAGQADADNDGRITAEELEDYVLTIMPQICPVCKTMHPGEVQVCPLYHLPLTGENRRQHPETGRILLRDLPVLVLEGH